MVNVGFYTSVAANSGDILRLFISSSHSYERDIPGILSSNLGQKLGRLEFGGQESHLSGNNTLIIRNIHRYV